MFCCLRLDLHLPCIHILPMFFPFVVFNDFVMPSLFPAHLALFPTNPLGFIALSQRQEGLWMQNGQEMFYLCLSRQTNFFLTSFDRFTHSHHCTSNWHDPFQRTVTCRQDIVSWKLVLFNLPCQLYIYTCSGRQACSSHCNLDL